MSVSSTAAATPAGDGGGCRDDPEEKKTDPPSPPDLPPSLCSDGGDRSMQPNNSADQNGAHHVHFSVEQRKPQHLPPSHPRHPSQTKPWTDQGPSTPRVTSFRRSSSAKSWTDQRAPEPFSSHNPTKQTGKKFGYGDIFKRSSSFGKDTGRPALQRGGYHGRSESSGGGFANGSAAPFSRRPFVRRGDSVGSRKQPSFSQSDFPLLSPTKQKPQRQDGASHKREASWSAVVGGSEGGDDQKTSGMQTNINLLGGTEIPPLPLWDPVEEENANDAIDVDKEVVSEEDDTLLQHQSSPMESSRTYWQQSQRRRAHSFHHYPPDHRIGETNSFSPSSPKDVYHPFSTFTIMSIAALQNDIGTLLARIGRREEAIERYRLSIGSAEAALEGLQSDDGNTNANHYKDNGNMLKQKCPRVTEAEGLAWFRQKLLRGDMAPVPVAVDAGIPEEQPVTDDGSLLPPPPPFQPAGFGGCARQSPRRMRSASFGVADMRCPPTKQLSMPRIGQTRSIDDAPKSPMRPKLALRLTACPVTAPQPVKPTISVAQQPPSPRLSRSNSTGIAHGASSVFHRHAPAAPLDDIVHDIYQHQKLDCPDEVYSCNGLTPLGLEYICDPLPTLGSSLRRMVSIDDDSEIGRIIMESAALVSARLNLASLEYRMAGGGVGDELQRVLADLELALADCLAAIERITNLRSGEEERAAAVFCRLKAIVHSNVGAVKYRLKKVRDSMTSFEAAKEALEESADMRHHIFVDSEPEPHDDDRFPPRSFLLLVARLNMSRVALALDRANDANTLCDSISEDNKPHRRASSTRIRSERSVGHRHGSLRRSNSFSAATSALDTAILAYEHDIDRRSKWLCSVAEHYIAGLIHEAKGDSSDHKEAWHHYNRLLSLARVKLDHRHAYICSLLERRGAVLFEQRKLQQSMLSYLACLKILEHQQSTGSNIFNLADLSRVLYSVARVLHDKEEYHDALHMYHRALACQRELAADVGRPSLDVITTLCNICRVHHLSGEIDAALAANKEVLELATVLVGGKMEHPFLIHRMKVEGNILVEAGRLEDAMTTFVDAARRCNEGGLDQMMMRRSASSSGSGVRNSQEDADAGDSSVLSIRSAAALAQINFFHPSAASA